MTPHTQHKTTARRYVWALALLAGMLLGAGAMYVWFGTNVMTPRTEPTPQVASLRVLSTQALYMNAFKPPPVLRQLWQDTQQTIAAKVQPANLASEGKTSLISRMLEPIAPVQTAQASTSHIPAVAANNKAPSAKATSPVSPAGAASKDNSDFPDVFGPGTLGELTKLRAELEHLKMQVVIEETRSRLNQLRGGSTYTLKKNMPSLEFPPIGMPGKAAASQGPLRILSIQSINGKYAATMNTPSGPRAVRVNDTVGDGRVVSITRNSVIINRGQGNETLSIQD